MSDRRIAFERIDNFRDFGGYAAGPRRLKRGLLYRSGHMAGATEADLEKLAGLGLSLVVDLRRPVERTRHANRYPKGFAGQVVDNDTLDVGDDDLRAFLREAGATVEQVRGFMLNYYRNAPFTQRHRELYTRYFQLLADTDGPVLVHCAAGKDRTGIICALTHHVAGVHPDDIVEDYLLTNDAERIAKRMPLMAKYVRDAIGFDPDEDALRAAMSAEAGYLEESFKAMVATHGSLDGYLDQALGLDAATRGRLHDRLLA